MIKTEFFNDFIQYYKKAECLEYVNLGKLSAGFKVNDPIMDNVTIYDTVHRKYAGFSKVLEDIHGVRTRKDLSRLPDYSKMLNVSQFHFLHLIHRFAGSGASFQPRLLPDGSLNPKEHGYTNSIVGELAELKTIWRMKEFIVNNKKPMVTSTGNQPPSLKNPNPEKYRLAQQYYFNEVAEDFISDYVSFIYSDYHPHTTGKASKGIKEAVDFCLDWHKQRGFKQWHFVLTAFVMDTAEYYPMLIDPESHCYYGANCIRGFDLMFKKEAGDPKKKDQWYEACMTELCKAVNGRPYDVEDVVCDVIRYWSEYIPKGYDHLKDFDRLNNSTLKKHNHATMSDDYPPEIQQRLNEVLK